MISASQHSQSLDEHSSNRFVGCSGTWEAEQQQAKLQRPQPCIPSGPAVIMCGL